MKNKAINRFVILCRIKYAASDQVIDFKLSKENKYLYRMINIDRNISMSKVNKSVKHQLSEIDKFTSQFSSEEDLLKRLSIIKDVYDLSATYSTNGSNRFIELVYNNYELIELLQYIENDKLKDNKMLRQKDMLVQKLSTFDTSFSSFYLNSSHFKTKSIINSVREMININKIYKSTGLDSEATCILEHNKDYLLDEFNKYHLYRGLFLTYQDYKNMPQSSKPKEVEHQEVKKVKKIEFNQYSGEQLKF